MKRTCLLILSFIAACSLMWAGEVSLAGIPHHVDTMASYPVGPGAQYVYLRFVRTSGTPSPMDAFYLVVDGKNPYVGFEQALGRDAVIGTEAITSVAKRKTTDTRVYFAATNGDFFATTGDVGRPTGYTIGNNEFAYTPHSNNRRVGAIDENNIAHIGNMMSHTARLVLADTAFSFENINYKRGENALVLYNRHNGATTLTNAYGTELAIELLPGYEWHTNGTVKAKITSKEINVGNMAIVPGQAVISGHGTMATVLNELNVGDEVAIETSLAIDGQTLNIGQCIGGDNYALIVENGEVPTSNFWNELHPRTAFGATQNGDTLIFCVVDGRQAKSVGCTTQILGAMMKHMGAYTAVNWDGGGSSHLYIRNIGLMNAGCESSERAVGNGMYVVANVPEADNTIAKIVAYQAECRLPQYGIVSPKFLGFNKYGVMIDTDVQGVTLSCEPEVGKILEDGHFMADTPNGGMVTAHLGDITTQIHISLIQSAEISFRLDSVIVDNTHPYTVEITSTIGTETVSVLADALTWLSMDETICTVDAQGRISGVSNGYANVIGNLGDFADTILVHVQIAPQNPYLYETFTSESVPAWVITGSNGYNPVLNPASDTENAQLGFNYSVTRGAFVKLERQLPLFGLPDTVNLILRTDAKISKLIIGLRPNDLTSVYTISNTFTTVAQNEWVTLSVPVQGMVANPGDRGIFPIWMEYINIMLDSKTPAGQRKVELKGIELIYEGETYTGIDLLDKNVIPADKAIKIATPEGVRILRNGNAYDILGNVIE